MLYWAVAYVVLDLSFLVQVARSRLKENIKQSLSKARTSESAPKLPRLFFFSLIFVCKESVFHLQYFGLFLALTISKNKTIGTEEVVLWVKCKQWRPKRDSQNPCMEFKMVDNCEPSTGEAETDQLVGPPS